MLSLAGLWGSAALREAPAKKIPALSNSRPPKYLMSSSKRQLLLPPLDPPQI